MLLTDSQRPQPKPSSFLTRESQELFKMLFSSEIEDGYRISTIDSVNHARDDRPLNSGEKAQLYEALCRFTDDATTMTYTEVEEKYGRRRDESDSVADSQSPEEEFPMVHYGLALKGQGKNARIHGYIRNGIFVVRRLDWGHRFHSSPRRSAGADGE